MATPKPVGQTAEGWPIWARNAAGQPICGYRKKASNGGGVCQQTRGLGPSGRCCAPGHGGKQKSMAEARAIKTREAVADYIADDPRGLAPLLDVIKEAALKKRSTEDAKWLVTMNVGGPKSTTVVEISEAGVVDAAARAIAILERDLEIEGLHERWLALFQKELESSSKT